MCQAGGLIRGFGTQCGRAQATCFVDVQHEGEALGCFSLAAYTDCVADACDENKDCPREAPVCMRVAGTDCCSGDTQPTGICVAPCP